MIPIIIALLIILPLTAFAGPKNIYYAGDYAKLDSDVVKGGGTDDTKAIQNILDKAKDGRPVKLVMDGAALVTGLTVWSNTTIECLNPSCGFFLKDGSDCAIIRNGNASFDSCPEKRDKNITLTGGTWNHNAAGQQHHITIPTDEKGLWNISEGQFPSMPRTKFVMAFELYGVENLKMKDMTIMNQRSFTALIANFRFVDIENINIVLNDYIYANNQDGFHFFGPGSFLNMRNITGTAGDDFIALAPDERDGVSSISDVMIDGVHLNGSDQGIRLLCWENGTLERVLIKNVTGTFKGFGFYINPWLESKKGGCYRDIIIDTVALDCTEQRYPGSQFLFSLGGNIENITFKNIHYKGNNPHNLLEIRSGFVGPSATKIGNLVMKDVYVTNDPNTHDYVRFLGSGVPVKNMIFENVNITGGHPGGSFISAENPPDIENLVINGFRGRGLAGIFGENIEDHVKNLKTNNIDTEE